MSRKVSTYQLRVRTVTQTDSSVTNLPIQIDRQVQGDFCCMHFGTKAETQVLNLCKAFGHTPGKRGWVSPQPRLLLLPGLLAPSRYR